VDRVVCRALNWIESDLHKLSAQTCDIVFVSERATPELPDPAPGMALLAETLVGISRRIERFELNAQHPSTHIVLE
jgi:hypothetical protein